MKNMKFFALLASLILLTLPVSAADCGPRPAAPTPVRYATVRRCPRYAFRLPDAFAFPDTATPAVPDTATRPDTTTPADNAPAVPDTATRPNTTTPADTTPATNPDASGAMSAYETEVVRLVNEIRARYGLSALSADAQLSHVARLKSQDMRDKGYFSHESPTYGSPFQMLKSFGISYRAAGENIAYGYATPQSVADAWMNSDGHRANILNGSYTRLGVGYVASGHYWTQLFTG